jgi:alanine racemase
VEKSRLFAEVRAPGWVVVPAAQERAIAALERVGAPVVAVPETEVDWPAPELARDAELALEVARRLGIDDETARGGLSRWRPAPGRLEIAMTPRGVLLLNDAYTADPESVVMALRVLQRDRSSGRSVAVLGGMAQLGLARERAHREVGEEVARLDVDRLVAVGEGGAGIAAAAVANGYPAERVTRVAAAAEAAVELDATLRPGDRVLLKASQPDRLEQVAAELLDAVSSTRLFIDLDAIVENHRALRARAGGTPLMAVVKSYGYGADSVRLAQTLEHAGCEAFCVAFPDEGALLRARGIRSMILVQNVLPQEVDKLFRHGLSAEVGSFEQLELVAGHAASHGAVARLHLKFDTGMGRIGFLPADVDRVAAAVLSAPSVRVEGLMTHFAGADDPGFDDLTREQIAQFVAVRDALGRAGIRPRYVHAANTSGVVRFPEARFSMVRSGIGLFGFGGAPGQRRALRLLTRVISVKELPEGHPVGYGFSWRAQGGPRRVAVVALGYNDGYPRALSNRGWMAVNGVACPVVGRVCMDVTMLDVTGVGAPILPGSDVVVFGTRPGEPDLSELARLADTIEYELLTRLSPRVRRIFETTGA